LRAAGVCVARDCGRGTRARRRKITYTMAARMRYTTDSVPYPTGTPPAPVTADDTRITS
jgi:hypothetical protein